MISSYTVKAPNNAATAVTRFTGIGVMINDVLNTTATDSVMPMAGTIQNFYLQRSAAVGAGNTLALNITKNGTPQTMGASISGASQLTANDTVNTVSFSAGDTIGMQWVGTGTPPASNVGWGWEINGTGQAILSGASNSTSSNTATTYLALQNSIVLASAPALGSIASSAGTISNLYMTDSVAPGAGKSYTATLIQNGSATALTAQISGASATTANDTTHTVTIAAGDYLYWQVTPAGTPTGGNIKVAAQFTPTTDGESIHTFTSATNLATSGFNISTDGVTSISPTELNRSGTFPSAAVYKNLYVALSAAPNGAGKSYTATVRDGLADTTVTTTISNAATTGNDTTHTSSTTTPGNYVGVNIVGSGTPTAVAPSWGFTSYIAPAVPTTRTQTGVARITVATSRTQTGVARVQVSTSRTQTGVARIALVTTRNQTGVARITASAARIQTGVGRVTATTSRTQTGKADIRATTSRTQTGVANIYISSSGQINYPKFKTLELGGGLAKGTKKSVARVAFSDGPPIGSPTGYLAVFDYTNNKLYIYNQNTATWKSVLLT